MQRIGWVVLLCSLACFVSAGGAQTFQVGADCAVVWTAPTTNSNGTPLTDLGGYHIFVRTVPLTGAPPPYGAFKVNAIATATSTTCALMGITADGTYQSVVKAYDTSGNESVASNEITIQRNTVPPAPPTIYKVTPGP